MQAIWRWTVIQSCVLLAVGAACWPSHVSAQPLRRVIRTLQSSLAEGEMIVHGTMEKITPLNPGNPFKKFTLVKVRVHETLLGEPAEHVSYVAGYSPNISEVHGIFVLTRSPGPHFNRVAHDQFFTRAPWVCLDVVESADDSERFVVDERGISLLRGGETILNAARSFVEDMQRDAPVGRIELRISDRGGVNLGLGTSAVVPLDVRLIAYADLWAKQDGELGSLAAQIKSHVYPIVSFEQAKAKVSTPQSATRRRWANILWVDSLETMTADCDLIVRGTIEDLVLTKKGRDTNENYDVTLDRHLVKLRVTEKLKGNDDAEFVSFDVENGGPLSEWQKKGTEVLVFLKDRYFFSEGEQLLGYSLGAVDPGGSDRGALRYWARKPGIHGLIALDDPHPKMYSANLNWLQDPAEILSVVRQYLEDAPSARERGEFSIADIPGPARERVRLYDFSPQTLIDGTRWNEAPSAAYLRFNFPIDENLEKHARQWVRSEDKVHRWLGVNALTFFPSDENAEILKSLLDDPAEWPRPIGFDDIIRDRPRRMIPWEAERILVAWGYMEE